MFCKCDLFKSHRTNFGSRVLLTQNISPTVLPRFPKFLILRPQSWVKTSPLNTESNSSSRVLVQNPWVLDRIGEESPEEISPKSHESHKSHKTVRLLHATGFPAPTHSHRSLVTGPVVCSFHEKHLTKSLPPATYMALTDFPLSSPFFALNFFQFSSSKTFRLKGFSSLCI